MPTKLRRLKITRSDLVDRGANYDPATGEGAHVLLYKRVDDEDEADDADDYGKRDYSPAAREHLATQGHAMAGGRYPIANVQDLRNAVRAYGRGAPADRDAIRRHIIRRARALGHLDVLPDDWKVRKAEEDDEMDADGPAMPNDILAARHAREQYCEIHDAFMESFQHIMYQYPSAEQPALLQEAVKQFGGQLATIGKSARHGLDEPGQSAFDTVEDLLAGLTWTGARIPTRQRAEQLKQAMDTLKGVLIQEVSREGGEDMPGKYTDAQFEAMQQRAEAAEAERTTLHGQVTDLTKRAETAEGQVTTLETRIGEHAAELAGLKAQVEKLTKPVLPQEEIWKGASPEARAEFERLQKLNEENAELAKAERERRERQEFISEVRKFDYLPMHPDDDWETLRDLRLLPEKSQQRITALLKVANELGKRAKVIKSIGVDGKPSIDDESAEQRITKMSRDLITKGEAKTFTEALTEINRRDPLLYAEYREEQRNLARRNFVADPDE